MKKILIVTGGGRGIGAATAIHGARLGYSVVVNYREDRKSAEQVLEVIAGDGGEAIAVQADVSRERDVKDLFLATDRQLGPVTALVNNAGILHQQSLVTDMDAERLQKIFAVNAIAPE